MEYYKNLDLADIVYFDEIVGNLLTEKWEDITGYENRYKISTLGRVKSIYGKKRYKNGFRKIPIKIITQTKRKNRPTFKLYNNTGRKSVITAHVMALVFLNHPVTNRKYVVDHKNNIPYDNRLCNLQIITHRENDSKDEKTKTGFTGVTKSKEGRFVAKLMYKGKTISLGTFEAAEKANEVRQLAVSRIDEGKDVYNLATFVAENKYKHKGVTKVNNRFVARIRINRKEIHIGVYSTAKEAGEAYLKYKNNLRNEC